MRKEADEFQDWGSASAVGGRGRSGRCDGWHLEGPIAKGRVVTASWNSESTRIIARQPSIGEQSGWWTGDRKGVITTSKVDATLASQARLMVRGVT